MSEAAGYRVDPLGVYLNEIGKVPLLTAPEEVELAKAVEAGQALTAHHDALVKAGETPLPFTREEHHAIAAGNAAKDRFIRANLRLVVSVAKRYPLPTGLELLDLIQEGNLGLEHAVDKFDWRKGFKFSTYATFWIRQSIARGMDQTGSLIRVPGGRGSALRAARRAEVNGGPALSRDDEELYRLITPTSLDRHVGRDGDDEFIDILPDTRDAPDEAVIRGLGASVIEQALATLDPRRQSMVIDRFGLVTGEGLSYREIGRMHGVSSEAARRMVDRALKDLRDVEGLRGMLIDTLDETF